MNTKSVLLTEPEIRELITYHGYALDTDTSNKIERINYLNKRLKAFSEPEIIPETKTEG